MIALTSAPVLSQSGKQIGPGAEGDSTAAPPAASPIETSGPVGGREDPRTGFADYLFDTGEYDRAAIEYLRRAYSQPGEPRLALQLARCWLRLGKSSTASKFLGRAVFDSGASNTLADSLRFGIQATSLALRAEQAQIDWLHFQTVSDQLPLSDRFRAVKILDLMVSGMWGAADQELRAEKAGPGSYSDSPDQGWKLLAAASDLHAHPSRRSPGLAAAMSALVPGTGKIYCGRYSDAVYSLASIAFTSWESYKGFHDNGSGSVRGWAFGAMAAFLYGGNIYGSHLAARVHNEKSESALSRDLGLSLNYWIQF